MEGLDENWVYEYQKVLIDEKQGRNIVGFWKQIVNKTDGTQDEIYWHRRQLVPASTTTSSLSGSVTSSTYGHDMSRRCSRRSSSPGDLSTGMQEADRAQHRR